MISSLVVALVATADVESMSLDDLLVEQTRIELRPSLVPSGIMVGLGTGIGLACGLNFGVAKRDQDLLPPPPGRTIDGFGPGFDFSIIQVFSVIHAVFAAGVTVGGLFLMRDRVIERDEGALLLPRVRERIVELEQKDTPTDHVDVASRQLQLVQRAMPTYSLAGQLTTAGVLTLIIGSFWLGFLHQSPSHFVSGLSELAVGGTLLGLGIWRFFETHHEMVRLEEREAALRAVIEAPARMSDSPCSPANLSSPPHGNPCNAPAPAAQEVLEKAP